MLSKPIEPGKFRHRCTFYRMAHTVDPVTNQKLESPVELATYWASILPYGGNEHLVAGQVIAECTNIIEMRYIQELYPSDWMVYNGVRYNFLSILNVEMANQLMRIAAVTLPTRGLT